MSTASAYNSFGTSAHFHGNQRFSPSKLESSCVNFAANGEVFRMNLYPSSAFTCTSKVFSNFINFWGVLVVPLLIEDLSYSELTDSCIIWSM